MLQFGLAAALEVLNAAIGGEACGIPKSDWVLHTELVLERTQRRCGVVGPVTPGASGQTILSCENNQNRSYQLLKHYEVISTYQQHLLTTLTDTLAYAMTKTQTHTSHGF